ncbi:unnamed protein product [Linum trigynum]|uniref:DUF4283 domain-containing protein n=1 Tax=Linum trigynum TaxID=586398 RepID=A0AAV2CJJ3_9ROSI
MFFTTLRSVERPQRAVVSRSTPKRPPTQGISFFPSSLFTIKLGIIGIARALAVETMHATRMEVLPTTSLTPIKVNRLDTNSDSFSCSQACMMARVSSDQVVQFSMEAVQSSKYHTKHSLLGCLFTNKRITTMEVRDVVITHWQVKGKLKVVLTKHGLFEFTLPSEETKTWVLKRTPWVVNDIILHLRSWTTNISKKLYDDLAMVPLRVQMWDVKEDCCTQ